MPHEPNYQPGVYSVEVTGQKLGQSRKKGTPQFALKFKPCYVENPSVPEGQEGQWAAVEPYEETAYFYLSDAAAENSISKLRRLGFILPEPRVELLDEDTSGFLSLIGQQVRLECQHEIYNGELQAKWDVAKAKAKPCDQNVIRDLNALWGRHFVGEQPVPPATPPQPTLQSPQVPQAEPTPSRPTLSIPPDPIPDGSPLPDSDPSPDPDPATSNTAGDLPF